MFLFKIHEKIHQTALIRKVTKSFTAHNLLQQCVVSSVLNSQLWVLVPTGALQKDALLQLVLCLFSAVDHVFPWELTLSKCEFVWTLDFKYFICVVTVVFSIKFAFLLPTVYAELFLREIMMKLIKKILKTWVAISNVKRS